MENRKNCGLKRAYPYSLPYVPNDTPCAPGSSAVHQTNESYDCKYVVIYGQVSSRKHKKWEGDGFLYCKDRTAILKTEDGDNVARSSAFSRTLLVDLSPGTRLIVGGFEVEIQENVYDANQSSGVESQLKIEAKEMAVKIPSVKKFSSANRQFVQPFSSNDHRKEESIFVINEDCGGGVILADEMGLGKSVQTISLILSLFAKKRMVSRGLERYLLIVPASLLGNWQLEFSKWAPYSENMLFHIKKANEFNKYLQSVKCSPIAMMSYEMVAYIGEALANVKFSLVVCDEAHRLKNPNGRLHCLIKSLQADRRLLLTGTPLQNDSNELFALLNLARPGAFGTLSEFNKVLKGNSEEGVTFSGLLSSTFLRRTAEINNQYLPEKYEYLLFCRMSSTQQSIYLRIKDFMTFDYLKLISMLRKLCNHPLIMHQSVSSKLQEGTYESQCFCSKVLETFPLNFASKPASLGDSGKLSVFMELMKAIRETGEKVVIVSNFTKTLDMLQTLCSCLYFNIYRLDGSVLQQKRMEIVKEFNSSTANMSSVFLLSTKAGGVGLNLYGASRLILFDSDWNPAVDAQAMARIWRDGQTKPCHIYRLVTTGSIEEKILQRQVMKTGLSTVIESDDVSQMMKTQFSEEELSDIFSLDCETSCNTHDLMECNCNGDGLLPIERDLTVEDEIDSTFLEIPSEIGDATEEVSNNHEVNEESIKDLTKEVVNDREFDVETIEGITGKVSNVHEVHKDSTFTDTDDCESVASLNDTKDLSKPADEAHAITVDKKLFLAGKLDKKEKATSAMTLPSSVSMAALLQWRHYSQDCSKQFELFKAEAGFGNCALNDVTFVMKIVRNY